MEEKKINIQVAEGVSEIIIREGQAIKVLDPKPPVKIDIKGVIQAPYIFLSKRVAAHVSLTDDTLQLDIERTHVIVDREKVSITLIVNENDDYTRGVVVGKLETHPKFKEFGINDHTKQWEPNELGQFLKMNRAFFADKSENMNLVTLLKNFKAKVDGSIEKTKSDKGSFADNYSAEVNSNLPGTFKVNIPLFKGFPAEEIEVEFYASVNGRDFTLELVSPGACQAFEEIRDSIIDAQIEMIEKVNPLIPIIEQ